MLVTLLALLLLLWLATAAFTAGVLMVMRAVWAQPPAEAVAWALGASARRWCDRLPTAEDNAITGDCPERAFTLAALALYGVPGFSPEQEAE